MPIYPLKGAKGITYQARWGKNLKSGQPFTKNFKLRKEAVEFLSTVGSKPYISDRESLTLGQAIDQWLIASSGVGTDNKDPVRPDTAAGYKKAVKPLRCLVLSDGTHVETIKLSKLTKSLVMRIRDALLETCTRDTAARAFNRLKSALLEAMRREQLLTDPIRGVGAIIVKKKIDPLDEAEDGEVMFPQPAEIERLLATAYEQSIADDGRTRIAWQRYRLLIEVLAKSGLRPCEARGLMRRHVLPERRLIRVRHSADPKGVINPPKTDCSKRDVVIPQDLADELAVFLLTLPSNPETLIFANSAGKPESLANIYNRCWYPLLQRAGLPRYRLYSLRHFYASMLIAMGAREKRLTQAMGHKDVAFTMNIYGKLFQREMDQDVAMADGFSAFIGTGSQGQATQTSDESMIRDNVTVLKSTA